MHLRIARPSPDPNRTALSYCAGLGWVLLGRFENHEGFDGVMVGPPHGAFHLEFTLCRHHAISPQPTEEDLLILYVEDRHEWMDLCAGLLRTGFREAVSFNPYWERSGRTFVDCDGYRIVLQNSNWVS